jgi:hypothetical protein
MAYAAFLLKVGALMRGILWQGGAWNNNYDDFGALYIGTARAFDIAWSAQNNALMVVYSPNASAQSSMLITGAGSAGAVTNSPTCRLPPPPTGASSSRRRRAQISTTWGLTEIKPLISSAGTVRNGFCLTSWKTNRTPVIAQLTFPSARPANGSLRFLSAGEMSSPSFALLCMTR